MTDIQQRALAALYRIKNDLGRPDFDVDLLEEGGATDLDIKLITEALLVQPVEYAVRYFGVGLNREHSYFNQFGSAPGAENHARDWAMGATGRTLVRRRSAGVWEDYS